MARRKNNKTTKHVDTCLETSRDGGSNPPASILRRSQSELWRMPFVALRNFSEAERSRASLQNFSVRGLMKYVYILESTSHPAKRYVGLTTDLNNRLKEHNAGKLPHTAKFRPWRIIVAIGFTDDQKAGAFERYLKSGSGHAFAKKHFW